MGFFSTHHHATHGPLAAKLGFQQGKLAPAVWLAVQAGGDEITIHLDSLADARTLAERIAAAVSSAEYAAF